MGYAKLFSSITESSLWSEPKEVRLLFVTMLAKANSMGFVETSLPGLARVANLSQEEVESSLKILESPDQFSKNPELDGRRIVKAPGGYMVVNYEDYRNRTTEEERREYMREYMRKYRQQKARKHPVNNVKKNKENSYASASASVPTSEEIYAAYPRKVAKPDAIRAIEKAMRKRDPAYLLERTIAYSKTQPKNYQFTPHPATWFNADRFDDDPEFWQPNAKDAPPDKNEPAGGWKDRTTYAK